MATHSIRGTHFWFEDSGTGPTLVLLHGFPLDSRIWEEVATNLRKDFRVITIDLRGFGKSPTNLPFTIESLGDDVHEILTAINALPCTLAGLSMGGYVVLGYAKKYPADLSGLILVDTKAEGETAEGRAGRNQMIEIARTQGSSAIADKMEPKMLAEITKNSRPDIVKRLRQIMEECPAKTIEHALAAMRDREDYIEFLSTIRVPSLFIVGESDAIAPPSIAESVQKKIPDCKLAVIKDAGHMAPIEQPQRVSDAIRKFMAHS